MTPEIESLVQQLIEAGEKATPGPWRTSRRFDLSERDRTVVVNTVYGIAAGERNGPFKNVGHFHPEDDLYFHDEINVVEISSDRDYGYPEGAIEKLEDATYIALANPANITAVILAFLEELKQARRDALEEAINDIEDEEDPACQIIAGSIKENLRRLIDHPKLEARDE